MLTGSRTPMSSMSALCRILVDTFFDLVTECAIRPWIARPRHSPSAQMVCLRLLGHFQQHVDLTLVGAAVGIAIQDAPHPSRCLRGTACTGRSSRAL